MIDETYYNIAKKYFSNDELIELYSVIDEIINHEEFQKRKKYLHHDDSVYEHCICVCIRSIYIAKKLPFSFDYKAVAIGGLLHDFYYNPWQEEKEKTSFFKQHGYIHPIEALDNSTLHFDHLLDDITNDIIKKHMWPLTIRHIPLYRESWVVNTADKIESLKVFKNIKKLPKYVGIK